MAETFFSDFTEALLHRWPDKNVNPAQITGALRTSLNPEDTVNALAEVFRVTPVMMEQAVSELGLGDMVARKALQSQSSSAAEPQILCKTVQKDAFPELFRFYASPNPENPAELPAGLAEGLYRLSSQLAAQTVEDPFLQLYRVNVGEYYEAFQRETALVFMDEIEKLFHGNTPRYLITTGIGANEQFCHFAAAMNNRNSERKMTWLPIHSPMQLDLLPEDASEDNTLFLEFSRSSVTEETIKLHEYTSRGCRRVVFTNGGGLKKLAERDGNLILHMPDQVSGRYGRNKTPILLAPMLAAGMDTDSYWKNIEKAIHAFPLDDPDSLPQLIGRFILAYQKARGTDFIYLGCNDDALGLLGDELIQFWNEGVNKNGNDLLMSRFFGLPRDSHMNLEGVLGNRQTKLGFFLLRDTMRGRVHHPLVRQEIDAIDPAHAGLRLGDEEAVLSLANYRRFTEVMPSMLLQIHGELTMEHSAVLGQLFSDMTFVYSRLMGIDPGSNPEVKFVRERSAKLLSGFAEGIRSGKAPTELFTEQARG